MNPDLWKALQNLVMIAVTAFTTAMMGWLLAHGYIKQDIEAAKVEAMAQTDEQTETMKDEAKKTRQKVVEETNEVSATAEKVATELVEAVPMRAQATDPAIAELLLDLTARMDKIEGERVTP